MSHFDLCRAGVTLKVPSVQIGDKTVIVTGSWLRVASINDEEWQEHDITSISDEILRYLRQRNELGADIFIFGQQPNDPIPHFPYFFKWESIAAIPIVSFSDWWTSQVSTDLRKDVRRAAKSGVVIRQVPFNDCLVRGIVEIYDETPIRQGKPFWHYKEGFAAVKAANATYLERSDFLGAFWNSELIGFLKIVYVNRLGLLMQIVAKEAHRDKRPANALISKAVELCYTKGCSHLTYGKYRYPQGADGLTAFKHRNGFEEIMVPKYYVPLTAKGRMALHLGIQDGVKALLPSKLLQSAKHIRSLFYRFDLDNSKLQKQ